MTRIRFGGFGSRKTRLSPCGGTPLSAVASILSGPRTSTREAGSYYFMKIAIIIDFVIKLV